MYSNVIHIMVNFWNFFSEALFAIAHLSYYLALDIEEAKAPPNPNPHPHPHPNPHPTPHPTPPHHPPTIHIHTLKPDPPPPTTPPPPVCNIGKAESINGLFADCSNKKLTHIPGDLGHMNNALIKVLDLSNNHLTNLTDSDLKNYTYLVQLIMVNISTIKSFPQNFFSHTVFLEKLDISGTQISDFSPISTFLYILNATNVKATRVDVAHLVSLRELHLKDNPELKRFPTLSRTAPLTHIDVRFCSMINLTYGDLAPFCLLKYFGLESKELQNAPNTSECCGIKNWTTFFQIPGAENQICGTNVTDDPCKKMNHTLSLNAIGARSECLKRSGFFSFITTLIEIFIGVVVTSAVVYFICINSLFKKPKNQYYDDDYYSDRYGDDDADDGSEYGEEETL